MLGKNQIKLITSLTQKKYRDKHGLFIAEGPKLIQDLLSSGIRPHQLLTTHDKEFALQEAGITQFQTIEETEMKKISLLKTPQGMLGVFKKPGQNFRFGDHRNDLTLCLDGIQDPGNMGTILRLADWFGFSPIVCSMDSADVFNPKVVQASMGALGRVSVHYTDLAQFCLSSASELKLPVFGTFMDGENIYTAQLPEKGLIIMGNEGQGIRPETADAVTSRLAIPGFSSHPTEMESLNVAVATAIVCAEFKRQITFPS